MSFQYIDIHSHLNFAAFDADREEVMKRAQEAGVAMVNVGTQKDTSLAAVQLSEKYADGVFAIVGMHPIHTSASFHDEKELGKGNTEFTSRGEAFDYDFYKKLAMHPKVVGIGECGLDYYRLEAESEKKQREAGDGQDECLCDEQRDGAGIYPIQRDKREQHRREVVAEEARRVGHHRVLE